MQPNLIDLRDESVLCLSQEGEVNVLGRGNGCGLRVSSRTLSRQQFQLQKIESEWVLKPLSELVPTSLNDVEVDSESVVADGDVIGAGGITWRFQGESVTDTGTSGFEQLTFNLEDESDDFEAPIKAQLRDSDIEGTILGGAALTKPAMADQRRIWLSGSGVLGRDSSVDHRLNHPLISAQHAQVIVDGLHISIEDMGSTNGTFVNGERLAGSLSLFGGEIIHLGPFELEFTGDAFLVTPQRGNVWLSGHGLIREVKDSQGETIRILDDVDAVIAPGRFVALIGPSGSGKSTLLRLLCGKDKPQAGEVRLNGIPLLEHFDALKQGLATIAQNEILHEELTLDRALIATARLRLPPDTPQEEVEEAVNRALAGVSLLEHRQTKIKLLSGGQRKRAALANETLCSPHLVFADEVTSGLDEDTDREIMRLLRSQAEEGASVVTVTHNLANVQEFCHEIIILAQGGIRVFQGTPSQALDHFKVQNLGQIYDLLKTADPKALEAQYLGCDTAVQYLHGPLREQETAKAPFAARNDVRSVWKRDVKFFRHHLKVLAPRALAIMSTDRKALGIAIAQSLLVGLVLALSFSGLPTAAAPQKLELEKSLLFLVGISCFWFGCSGASKDIVQERHIFEQERDGNLSVPAYLGTKVMTALGMGALQVATLLALLSGIGTLPGELRQVAIVSFLSLMTGSCLGLLISSVTRTVNQATAAVPLVLIPQIVLSGRIVDPLPSSAESIAQNTVAGHPSYQAMAEILDFGDIPAASVIRLLLHSLTYLGVVLFLLNFDTRGQSTYWPAFCNWLRSIAQRRGATDQDS